MNYFQLFGLDSGFEVDTLKLSELYQALQKSVHPDRFAHASTQEQAMAVQKSAMINDAYQILKNPLQRAEYLLKIRGTEMPSEQSSFRDTGFLMQQMELRELIAEVKFSDDPESAYSDAEQTLNSQYQQLFDQLKQQLAQDNSESDTLACDNLRKLKFYQKLHLELDRLEEQIFED
ncbi:co-chaperone HscB [Thalassomonas sp. RHCl1]|uniref:co-chaperone HscB n=1 Tax=Thalassomonas sp. RHCl1 TaxID=2995320 RepID=UPI00248C07B6|nr:co-chaperone HscB [Thalassomonas sp. RHCl1]